MSLVVGGRGITANGAFALGSGVGNGAQFREANSVETAGTTETGAWRTVLDVGTYDHPRVFLVTVISGHASGNAGIAYLGYALTTGTQDTNLSSTAVATGMTMNSILNANMLTNISGTAFQVRPNSGQSYPFRAAVYELVGR